MSELNHDHDVARSLHRVVRAMHDGECPKCHNVHPSDKMPYSYWSDGETYRGWRCPSCLFAITEEEANTIFQIFAPFMERNLAVFEQWRRDGQAGLPR